MYKYATVGERVSREELAREIAIEKLYPPVVYLPDKNPVALFDKKENDAFNKLLLKLKEEKAMSESEVIEFVKKELPKITENRIHTLLGQIEGQKGIVRKEVVIKKEELAEYFKGLVPYRMEDIDDDGIKVLRGNGINFIFLPILQNYNIPLIRPFFENPKETNELFNTEMKALERAGFQNDLAVRCITFGMFLDDVNKFKTSSSFARDIIEHLGKDWREIITGTMEMAGDTFLEKHTYIVRFNHNNVKANLETCRDNKIPVAGNVAITWLKLPPDKFNEKLMKKGLHIETG